MDIITAENYLFGFVGSRRDGLNHILIELKKYTFYNLRDNVVVSAFCEHFQTTLRTLMIKEKTNALSSNKMGTFNEKWKNYTSIYHFRGPDMHFIYS